MGGGSSDCAFMINALNEEFNLNISTQERKNGGTTWCSCAFFINAKPVYATGIGDIMQPINISMKEYFIIIVKPNIHMTQLRHLQTSNLVFQKDQ